MTVDAFVRLSHAQPFHFMNFRIISALVMRYLFLYTRSPMRLVELVFWPLVDLVVWGNVTVFIQRHSDKEFGSFILFFLGAMILWDVLFRAQQGVQTDKPGELGLFWKTCGRGICSTSSWLPCAVPSTSARRSSSAFYASS